MREYRFHLEKYRHGSKTDCPNCGRKRCFVRYIDEHEAVRFPSSVGKCDHEQSCGYHYTPREYFRDNPEAISNDDRGVERIFRQSVLHTRPAPVEPSYIPDKIVRASLSHYDKNPLYRYLCGVFGEEETARLFSLYRIGTSAKWGGSTVFWQTDESSKVRTGKIMLYNPVTGRRVKEPQARVSWAHAELRLPDFNLRQCLFGQHLLPLYPDRTVFLVESEKSAVIAAHYMPDVLWLATGGKNGCFNVQTIGALRGRDVILLPDLGATDAWREKLSMLQPVCRSVAVSTLLEDMATDEQRSQGLDIADFMLATPTCLQILQQMIQRNPCIRQLINELGLELVEG
ncbi:MULTISPECIES: DUF6371 domain-containing protein [Bacteroidales]|uniref:DUF6371 domain-containing protein n=1 Tax=Bacteroidales TaxID=171549 RepID=UPI002611617E|nr:MULTISPECIES: DUF6371 domain-containing protein [Bacteroidales]